MAGTIGRPVQLPPMTVANGQTKSNVVYGVDLANVVSVMVYSPASLGGKTYKFKGHWNKAALVATAGWVDVYSTAGVILGVPAINTAQRYDDLPYLAAFYLEASADPGTDVVFHLTGVATV